MTDPAHDYERHDNDRGAQVRTVIQGLILAGIVGLVGMVIQQGDVRSGAGRWAGRLQKSGQIPGKSQKKRVRIAANP